MNRFLFTRSLTSAASQVCRVLTLHLRNYEDPFTHKRRVSVSGAAAFNSLTVAERTTIGRYLSHTGIGVLN